jgi:cytochrome c-type biogenesis protein CcmF
VQPDLRNIEQAIRDADRQFANAEAQTQGVVISAIVARYAEKPVPLPVRAIVSPMVMWIWIGGLIAVGGALLALWPAAATRKREAASAYKARLGGELTRA